MNKKTTALAIIVVLIVCIYYYWSNLINLMLPADTRPGEITFPVTYVTDQEFMVLVRELTENYTEEFKHIDIFRDSSVTAYKGPATCLRCHDDIEITDAMTGKVAKIDLMDNLTGSVHYRFFSSRHPNVYGFNGESADDFDMGKINRPCPKPGSFAMTAWAQLVVFENGDTLSEGCGQCHIGGQYAAPLGEMMPAYRTMGIEKEAVDCLICHAVAYDMNYKQVVVDDNGRTRWGQDRTMLAAMSVTKPTAPACLRCHQHNMGGDIYIDMDNPDYHQSFLQLGYERPRVRHPGSKRGTSYTPSWDVHAEAGMDCLDCHISEGHRIARGTHTTTIMANDLPGVEISCQRCHNEKPHTANKETAEYLNIHTGIIACQTCHIPDLHPDNTTRRDFDSTVFEKEQGIWIYNDLVKENQPGKGISYVWWNGDATFLGNPIGDNPNGLNLYRFYQPANIWPEYIDFDYEKWYETTMRPIAQSGRPSKLYAMKIFNGRQHIDLQNMGPFGGMFLPYNLPTYYTTGDPDRAVKVEMNHSMMRRMYGLMFKFYMLDRFISYMDVGSWNIASYEDARNLRKVEPRWLPQDASLEISHAVRVEGALTCNNCHSSDGILDFEALGYSDQDCVSLRMERE